MKIVADRPESGGGVEVNKTAIATRRAFLGSSIACLALISPLRGAVLFGDDRNAFTIAAHGQATPILVDKEHDDVGVLRVASDLAEDVERVCGHASTVAHVAHALPSRFILIGTLGRNKLIDSLVARRRLDVDPIKGKWESYLIETVRAPFPGVDEILVVAGSDRRGAIYGTYDISQSIGVSPWYWWADVPTRRQDVISLKYGRYHQGPPSVRYRGIFLNDEAPCLAGWAKEKFGGLNSQFYTKVFELLLRLRANYLWPAMWDNAFAEDDPDNPRLAEEYGIVMGSSHHEPMMRAQKEWTKRKGHLGNGQWNYITNSTAIDQFWREGIKRNRGNDKIVTIGMRGDGDVAMEGAGSLKANLRLLEHIITDQRKIISQELHKPAGKVPQVWVLFTEVQKYYDAGLKVPDDVTIMFSDDNVGNLRRLPTAEERKRSGGFGIYFHMDMHGGPFSYQWINSNPLPKIWEQMNLAHKYGANQIWIANVGDLKPLEIPIDFFLSMAWDAAAITRDSINEWTLGWARRNFGDAHAQEIAELAATYAKYNGWRKPELLKPDTYSLENYREAERVADAWRTLEARAEALYKKLPKDQLNAYYELVLHPVRACANLNLLNIAAARNRRFAEQARSSTADEAKEVRRRFALDQALSDYYNHELADGKWDHMMDQTHIGGFDWYPPPANIMPAVAAIDPSDTSDFGVAIDGQSRSWPSYYLPPHLPEFDSFLNRPSWFEIFPRGNQPVKRDVTARQPWIRLREGDAFSMGRQDRRYWVEIDWSAIPPGKSEGSIDVKGGGTEIVIGVTANKATPEQAKLAKGAYASLGPAYTIPAAGFSRNIAARGVRWAAIEDYGRVKTAMSIFPVTAASFSDPRTAPRLEYPIFVAEAGELHVEMVTSPTLQVDPARQLSVALGIDDAASVVKSVFTPDKRKQESFLGAEHDHNDAINARIMRFTLHVEKAGAHTLKVMMIDPTFVLQQLIVHRDPLPKSYFGPPEAALQR
ncbi:glycosyl hydrolase 115 family protein [Hephaestia mangrovi]|uniref:glycosyl hydrolase 115 family protein n=1 Tax=Hephaestia mangrovi TaxID=2873268 RepID=UPI001CA7290C|nr:glycosyl hydrolase 115 family protein [Hephaestia mangrovi]MBY8829868.1 glycosyl hydrolase 115 family protein [Hephaestia mangrovi]